MRFFVGFDRPFLIIEWTINVLEKWGGKNQNHRSPRGRGWASVAQWWENRPHTNVAQVWVPALTPYVGYVGGWFSPCSKRFSPATPVFHCPQKPTLTVSKSIGNARKRLNKFWGTPKWLGQKIKRKLHTGEKSPVSKLFGYLWTRPSLVKTQNPWRTALKQYFGSHSRQLRIIIKIENQRVVLYLVVIISVPQLFRRSVRAGTHTDCWGIFTRKSWKIMGKRSGLVYLNDR